jgi:membrane protease subunit HflK
VTGSRLSRLLLVGVAPLLLLVWLSAGVYSVESDQSGVAFVLGRVVGRDVLPGIHWNPAWPIGRVVVEKTATNFTMPVGYRMLEQPGAAPISDLWLTGDTNVVTGRLDIQYSIKSLTDLQLAHESPRELLRRELTEFVRKGVQQIVDAHGVGIQIQAVGVQELAPPLQGEVRNAFQEVQNANADRERAVFEARSYKAQVVAEAQGEAQRRIAEATGDRHRRIEIASGEAERFRSIAREHDRAPGVTEDRLYLETLERILPRIENYVVEPGSNGRVNLRVMR